MSDPIRGMARHRTVIELPEGYQTEAPAEPVNVYALTPGAGSSRITSTSDEFSQMLQDARDGVYGGGFLHHVI